MTVSGNEIPYNVDIDTQGIESLLQSIEAKLETVNDSLLILTEPDEADGQEETVSDNSILVCESLQRLEERKDTEIKLYVAISGLLLIGVGIIIGMSIIKWIPKR